MELAKRRFKVNTYQARYPYALRIQPQNHGENPELIHPPKERKLHRNKSTEMSFCYIYKWWIVSYNL
jgi:hypothetical protein